MAIRNDDTDDKTTPFIRGEHPGSPYRAPGATGAPLLTPVMFSNYVADKHRKAPKWAIPLFIGVVAFVGMLLGVMVVKSIWDIEMLERPKNQVDLAIAPAPPPPPPPPPGGVKPHDVQITPKKRTVKDVVQPVKIEKQEVQQAPQDQGDPNGEEGGEVGGVAGGVAGGVVDSPPPPPPPPPGPPQAVAPQVLDGLRIAGEKQIVPDDVTKTEIQRSGKDKLIGTFKLCLSVEGVVTSVTMIKSTGFSAYDNKIQGKMRAEWRYRPYTANGKAVPVCTAVTFIYSQK